jgi:exopolyphosphatase / guanosine-5'-triphosphate,3'-diphosphate pyrophosphatase
MNQKLPLIAAIDVGTNSFHLIIASVNSRGILRVISRDKEVVRLGSSGGDMKFLEADAINRGVQTLLHFSKLAKFEEAEIRAVATSAVREALNRDAFLNKVKEATGINIEVVSGPEEGRLIYIGTIHALPILKQKALVMDIGGGSTETIIGKNGNIIYVHSEKIGAIRLSCKFFPDQKISQSQIDNCRKYIEGEWTPILDKIKKTGFDTFIGTSGTITNLAVIANSLKNESIPEILNGQKIHRKDIENALSRVIQPSTLKQRMSIPGIDPVRADIIVGGALILEYAIKMLDIEKIILSSFSLREGIVFDTIQKKRDIFEYKHLSHLRYSTVYGLLSQYNMNKEHSEFVKKITLQIFDDLISLHNFDYDKRELLEAAALLHDIGYVVSLDSHHKHSYYILLNCIMPGFTNDEAEIIANIARYHRKSHPKKKHENFAKLTIEKQQIVRILASILRIAEGLDRRQLQVVNSVRCEYSPTDITIHIQPGSDRTKPEIELWGAERRKLLMEEIFGKKVTFKLNHSN